MMTLGLTRNVAMTDSLPEAPEEERMLLAFGFAASFLHTTVHSYMVMGSPNEQLAITNCLIVNPSDFADMQHVMVKQQFPVTVR